MLPHTMSGVLLDKIWKRLSARRFIMQVICPGQLEALLPVAHGKDVFVCMPTGGGKSLCMFLIPLSPGKAAMGIIISPLIGLIEQ